MQATTICSAMLLLLQVKGLEAQVGRLEREREELRQGRAGERWAAAAAAAQLQAQLEAAQRRTEYLVGPLLQAGASAWSSCWSSLATLPGRPASWPYWRAVHHRLSWREHA